MTRKIEDRKRSLSNITIRGETAFIVYKGTLRIGDRRLWTKERRKDAPVYFTCPRCGRILKLFPNEIEHYDSGTAIKAGDGLWYQSVWCDKEHHLWVHFDGWVELERSDE